MSLPKRAVSDSDTTRSFEWFLMEYCGLDKETKITIVNVDLAKQEFTYRVQILNAPGELIKTQSFKDLFIGNTSGKNQFAKFSIKSGFEKCVVQRTLSGSYPNPNWTYLAESIMITELILNQTDRDRLFPAA